MCSRYICQCSFDPLIFFFQLRFYECCHSCFSLLYGRKNTGNQNRRCISEDRDTVGKNCLFSNETTL